MPKHKPSSSSQSGEPNSKKVCTKSSRSDDNDESEEEELTNQSQRPDFTAPLKEREAECGIIEKISVKNFMCHGRLDCNFGPNVNFVVGRNGSGKSAILTAIVVGLGGKAIATSRCNSVKNFIKAGKKDAEVCIKLRNRGTNAYKPDMYGPSITVKRRILREGGNSYRIMSDKGEVISTNEDELSHIMDHFNIQIDNPVSIMNQETSKNFLLKQNAKDNYEFFLKATRLDQVSIDYREIMKSMGLTEEKVDAQSEKLPALGNEVLEIEQKFKACLHDLTNNRQKLLNQSAWAQVAELERDDLAGASIEVQTAKQHRKHYEEKKKELTAKIANLKKEADAAQKEVETLDTILEQKNTSLKNIRSCIAQRTKYYFIALMSTRGYSGQLIFNHSKEELILKVNLGESQKANDMSKDLRSLSGGEMSFSTVCLIMALWESAECPLMAIDEFDVSMDMMNRKTCIELLLGFAEDQPIRQFIFLTPQDMSTITPRPSVRIIQLPDPERN
ncbi:structural maintenance of chromosomes protein 6 isoform X1 [Strongylocentrotus purpuratus]|uniref:RecF/RecN/SMC N-terminal domain-containing protein n=1 Tax=Strongylocentrotus purpuratus TaxID=7668 RepID=A0A7M7HGZ6_STRPU|nr:structural maintenance of chromosomes protein 6 isoform X1 [Strongylocentrotus purpuratus]|eukprot:XP_011666300.1 PREDICTED: structural maintenance of chromosomes protein 6 isoform X1 [Strongylocentrotus purpuratus]